MALHENIYRLRAARNMSQGDLAEALDVSRQSISKWENGTAVPELDRLIKMSQLFGLTLDQLVGDEPPQTPLLHPLLLNQLPRRVRHHTGHPVSLQV